MFRLGRCRGHADGWNLFIAGARNPGQRAAVIVAVKQKLCTFCGQHSPQIIGIDEAPKITPRRAHRRVMDQYDAEALTRLLERFGETRQLAIAEPPSRQERTGRHAGRKRDQGYVAAAADERKSLEPVIAAHIVAPKFAW